MAELPPTIGNEMSDAEIHSLLESKTHGVLSMGAENRGYGIPISYSYEPETDRLVLGFVNAPASKKRQFASATDEVTLTVYNYEDVDSWESVIATGPLQSIDERDVSEQLAPVFFSRMDDDSGGDEWVDLDDVEREWYELEIEDLSGRHSGARAKKESL